MKSRRMLVVMKNSASPGRFPNAAAENGRSACVVLSTILRGTPRVLERQYSRVGWHSSTEIECSARLARQTDSHGPPQALLLDAATRRAGKAWWVRSRSDDEQHDVYEVHRPLLPEDAGEHLPQSTCAHTRVRSESTLETA